MTAIDILIVVGYVIVMTCLFVFSVIWLFLNWGIVAGSIGLFVACAVIWVSGQVVDE
jgi:hypothetical protein